MTRAKLILAPSVAALLLLACEGTTMAQTTTTTPGQNKIGTNYFLVPKGGYMLKQGQAGISVTYTYGLIVGGMDGAAIGLPSTVTIGGGLWQGSNVAATVGQSYWVKSKLLYSENGMNKETALVRGETTIVQE